jgi:hypothetical protein
MNDVTNSASETDSSANDTENRIVQFNSATLNNRPVIVENDLGRISITTSNSAVAAGKTTRSDIVCFDRTELDLLLSVYGRRVASGEWRDYAIDILKDKAVFSVFRRAAEVPIYRVEKVPKLARRQGKYAIISAAGVIMKRGHDLRQVLRVFEKSSRVVEF